MIKRKTGKRTNNDIQFITYKTTDRVEKEIKKIIIQSHQCFKINVREYDIRYTRRRQTTQKHNIICVEYNYTQATTNNVNKA